MAMQRDDDEVGQQIEQAVRGTNVAHQYVNSMALFVRCAIPRRRCRCVTRSATKKRGSSRWPLVGPTFFSQQRILLNIHRSLLTLSTLAGFLP